MFILFNIILILIAFVIQGTILKYISIWNVKPDIILLISVYAGLYSGKERGITVGIISGFIQDNMSVGILGVNTLSKGLIGYILGNIRHKILAENRVTQSFFIFLSSLFDSMFFLFISTLFLQFEIGKGWYMTYSIYQAIYNTIAGHILFSCISRMENRVLRLKRADSP